MLKKVRISIDTERHEIAASLGSIVNIEESGLPDGYLNFPTTEQCSRDNGGSSQENTEAPLVMQLTTEGVLKDGGERIEIRYEESELSGMQGARTLVTFYRSSPGFLSMLRSGSVRTALTFEEGKRYICTYQTPIMPFEVSIYTIRIGNHFDEDGRIELEYLIEVHGAQTEHCKLTMTVRDIVPSPFSKEELAGDP